MLIVVKQNRSTEGCSKHKRSVDMTSKIEKVPRGIRGEKSSKDMASSRNLVSTIGALASPKSYGKNGLNIKTNVSPKWDRTRCPEE